MHINEKKKNFSTTRKPCYLSGLGLPEHLNNCSFALANTEKSHTSFHEKSISCRNETKISNQYFAH